MPRLWLWRFETGARSEILWGYLLGGGLMVIAAGFEAVLGVAAERRSLEDVAPPLSSVVAQPGARPAVVSAGTI